MSLSIKIKYIPEIFPKIDFELIRKHPLFSDVIIGHPTESERTQDFWRTYSNDGIFKQLKQSVILERRRLEFPLYESPNYKLLEATDQAEIIDENGLAIPIFDCKVEEKEQQSVAKMIVLEYSKISSQNVIYPLTSDNVKKHYDVGNRACKLMFYVEKPPFQDWCELTYASTLYQFKIRQVSGLTDNIVAGTLLYFHCPQTPALENIISYATCYGTDSDYCYFESNTCSDIGTQYGYVILDAEPSNYLMAPGTAHHDPITIEIYTLLRPRITSTQEFGEPIMQGDGSVAYSDKIKTRDNLFVKFWLKDSELWKAKYAAFAKSMLVTDGINNYYTQQMHEVIKRADANDLIEQTEFDCTVTFNFMNVSMSR